MVEPVGTDEQRGDMFTKNLRVAKYEANRKLTCGWYLNNQPQVKIPKTKNCFLLIEADLFCARKGELRYPI
jgi:hypothetical protein